MQHPFDRLWTWWGTVRRPALGRQLRAGPIILVGSLLVMTVVVPGTASSARPTRSLIDSLGTIIDLAAQAPDLLIAGSGAGMNLGVDMATGDLDGDGIDDLVIGAPWAEGGSGEDFAGRIFIFFGRPGQIGSLTTDQADVTIIGAAGNDGIGGGITRQPGTMAIGDVNGDAFNDLVFGVRDAHGAAGEVRIVFGRSRNDWEMASVIDLETTSNGVAIAGQDAFDELGVAVAVGDLNGDGTGDVIAGAHRADGPNNNRADAGEVYVYFGRNAWPSTLSAEADADVWIVGAEGGDRLGGGLAVGQLGGTQSVDLAIGARRGAGPSDSRNRAGEVDVLFDTHSLSGVRDLMSAPPDWIVYGASEGDLVGDFLAIGDVSGDGNPDLALGIPLGNGLEDARTDTGEVMVLFGPALGATTDLADGADFSLYGPREPSGQSGNRFGDGLTLGDFNGDGVMDLAVGARLGDGANDARQNAGEVHVVFGGDLPSSLNLAEAEADISIYGHASGDEMGRVAAGNLDGTPPDDLALGAHLADVSNGGVLEDAGEVFVIYRQAAVVTPTATVTATATGTATPSTATPTATSTPTVMPTPTATEVLNYLPLILRSESAR